MAVTWPCFRPARRPLRRDSAGCPAALRSRLRLRLFAYRQPLIAIFRQPSRCKHDLLALQTTPSSLVGKGVGGLGSPASAPASCYLSSILTLQARPTCSTNYFPLPRGDRVASRSEAPVLVHFQGREGMGVRASASRLQLIANRQPLIANFSSPSYLPRLYSLRAETGASLEIT